ncbi:MAG: HNH endonuclease signature motif containing protein, partial [Actinomycetia bacterium]|nr:HNH endonuclease signature motif containing protein [Actinomycetes bacterium]
SPTHASRSTGSTSPSGSASAPESPSPHAAATERAHLSSTPPPDQNTGLGSEVPGEVFAAVTGALSTGISWLRMAALTTATTADAQATLFAHPETGALLDLTNELATTAYRPGRPMIQHIRQRDGRCRFPGCSTPARSCDIDHVVPWPRGQTEAINLMCLCRRHHRVKQRYRWRVRLLSDGRVQWIDPSGTEHTTYPVDHLGARELRSIRVVQHDETAQHDLTAQHDATGPDADTPAQHDATDEQHAPDQLEVPRLIDRLDLTSLDPSATETFHAIVMEHAILRDHGNPRAAAWSRGAILVDFVYKPTRPEGCGPPPRFVLSRRLRRYYKRQERKRRRQCPDQRPARTGRPGQHGLGSSIPDYGEPPF